MSIPHRRVAANDYRGYFPQRPASSGGMVPPALPPRRPATLGPAGSIYGSQFSGAYMSPYGGDVYGSSTIMPYPYRSTYPSRYGGYGYGGYGAEDPHSPFQSVESIVRAISSLSMMVESTYQSMYMSFRAVLGVAENMDQLRRVVFDLFGSLTLVKTFIWFCKKVLYILGLLKNNPVREKAWEAAAAEVVGSAPAAASRGKTWPLVAFFGLMLGGPYVLYKLASPGNQSRWDPQAEGGIKCVALHDFETDQKGELPFRRGDVLMRHNQVQGGWALASKKGGQIGYVPADRLKSISQIAAGAQQKPVPAVPVSRYLPAGAYGQYGLAGVPNISADLYYSEDDLQVPHRMAMPTVQAAARPSQFSLAGTPVAIPPPAASTVAPSAAPQSAVTTSVVANSALAQSAPANSVVVPPAATQSAVAPAFSISSTEPLTADKQD